MQRELADINVKPFILNIYLEFAEDFWVFLKPKALTFPAPLLLPVSPCFFAWHSSGNSATYSCQNSRHSMQIVNTTSVVYSELGSHQRLKKVRHRKLDMIPMQRERKTEGEREKENSQLRTCIRERKWYQQWSPEAWHPRAGSACGLRSQPRHHRPK